MSKRLKITTIVSDDETGDIIAKQESIITIEEETPKNYFGINNFNNIPHSIEDHLNHLKKYGTINEPITDTHNSVISDISEVKLNDEVLAACKEYIES